MLLELLGFSNGISNGISNDTHKQRIKQWLLVLKLVRV